MAKAKTKKALQQKKLVPRFELKQLIRHIGTGIEGMVHEIMTFQVVNTPQGAMRRELPEVVYTITYLDKKGEIHTFQTAESFFEPVETN